jgi:chitodextrinase
VAVTGYLIERCQGVGCSSFAQIAAPSGTGVAYSDTGLTAGTSYSYRVRATDGTGNLGGYSPVATAATPTPDVTPPSAPATLSAAAVSNTQVNLSWAAASDNVAVTGYLIERCQGSGCSAFVQIAAPTGTGTTYGDAGLTASTSYSYRVRATDGAGNLGPYSPVSSATTLSTPPAPVIPKFVQGNYATPQSNRSSVPITFTAAQRAGNFNVVIVGWNDTSASVTGVTDTKGNAYTRAIGPTQNPGALSQSIYYSANILGANAGGNTVTVTFSPAAAYADIRILEYSGVAHAGVIDGVAGASGSNATSSSGSLTTTAPGDLLVSGNMVSTLTHGRPAGGRSASSPLPMGTWPRTASPRTPAPTPAAPRSTAPGAGCTRPSPSRPPRPTPPRPAWRSPRPAEAPGSAAR